MIETNKFKIQLEIELQRLEGELVKIGRRNPDNPSDWEAIPGEWDVTGADTNESASAVNEFEENTAEVKKLEIMYNNVKKALGKIENGTYGKDEIDGTEIPAERLEANPSSRTKIENAHLVEDSI